MRRLAEPATLPRHELPESEWNDYERWFASIPTMLAISAVPSSHAPSGAGIA
ncbi:hypothetical protein [Occultella glacieicola]|uniref:hypothetical protein n=1 Tax=Occultella glacieicola TaxID=2518684 RepID=UPI0014052744|nr:hypothetical protein [Occultella glacieicola]